jgi:hypothetical protein
MADPKSSEHIFAYREKLPNGKYALHGTQDSTVGHFLMDSFPGTVGPTPPESSPSSKRR